MALHINRRDFLKGTAMAAGLTILSGCASKAARTYAANEKVNFANIGVGGRGAGHLDSAAGENLVALCDTNEVTLNKVGEKYPQAKKFNDYRKLFDEMGKSIDGVFVATPDHMHFPIAYTAMKMGKHCYCEKPLTHDIWEARKLAEIARQMKVATQMGNQGHSNEGWRILCEYVWSGALGNVTEVQCATNRPVWPQGRKRPAYTDPVPPTLNWDTWLGVAPERPYVKDWREAENQDGKKRGGVYEPFNWRGWWDFGVGALGDMACHIMDGAFWSLKLGEAKTITVSAESGGATDEMAPNWSIITFEYPARGKLAPVKVVWHDGGKIPARPKDLPADTKLDPNGYSIFHGDKNVMIADCYGKTVRIVPEEKMQATPRPEKSIPRVKEHHADFIQACKGGTPASSNFDYAGPFTEMILVGNLALRLGKKIQWDVASMKATNVPEAAALVRRTYRKGFVEV